MNLMMTLHVSNGNMGIISTGMFAKYSIKPWIITSSLSFSRMMAAMLSHQWNYGLNIETK